MIQGSKIKFGITSDLSGLSQGIIVNGIQKNNTTESAQARDHLGNIMDIAAYTDDKNVTIDGLYVSQSLKPGTIINIDNQNYMVTSTGREESNTAFQTASINARLYPGEGPGPGPGPEPIEPNPSLCFKGADDEGSYIQLNQYGSPDAVELVYRKNNGSWTTYNVGDVINLNKYDVVFISGANDHFSTGGNNFYYFTIDGKTEASGNIQSLMNFSDSCTNYCFYNLFRDCDDLLTTPQLPATTLAQSCYGSMFRSCNKLTSAPALPATNLAQGCYNAMFLGCRSLTSAPNLPATTLAQQCYTSMFDGCTSLSAAPALPATNLAIGCYGHMFANCTSLTSAPTLSASTLAQQCYGDMFRNCTSLSTAPQLPATTLAALCYWQMFENCSNLTSTPILSATELTERCYESMFVNCTSLTSSPQLPATTLAERCYHSMFRGCSSLYTAPALSATTLALSCYHSMFANCTSLSSINVNFTNWDNTTTNAWVVGVAANGVFTKPSALSAEYGVSRIPTNWQVVNKEDLEPLTFKAVNSSGAVQIIKQGSPDSIVLDYSINNGLWTTYNVGDVIELNQNDTVAFSGANDHFSKGEDEYRTHYYQFTMSGTIEASGSVQSLTNFSDSCTSACYYDLFYGCTSLITAPQLPATTLAEGCYWQMFEECSNLTTAPALQATTLADSCYYAMFMYCTSLTSAPQLPATTLAPSCYYSMFYCCTSLTTAPDLSATTLAIDCYNYMFQDCSSLSSINVSFTSWSNTTNWVDGVAANGIFYKPSALSEEYGDSRIPTNWQVVDKEDLEPLTFKAVNSSGAIQLIKQGSPSAIVLDYSKNNGPWTTYNVGDVIELNQNDTVAFSGANNYFSKSLNDYYRFAMSGTIEANNNIQSLMNFSDYCKRNCFNYLFGYCNSLIKAPRLPVKNLSQYYEDHGNYYNASYCYYGLFAYCTNLTTPPILPARNLTDRCYSWMFLECTSLTAAPYLRASSLETYCYAGMFENCTSLTSFIDKMYPAATLVDHCLYRMFCGCSNLSSIQVYFTDWKASVNATKDWVSGVAVDGTFTKENNLSEQYGTSYIPVGWTVTHIGP